MNEDDLINCLIWNFECKKIALDKIVSFKPPADNFELRMYHSLYLSNLITITEMMIEFFKSDFADALEQVLANKNDKDFKNNYSYLRELRNACIHRGLDISAKGEVVEGIVCVLSPPTITNRSSTVDLLQKSVLNLR